MNVILYKSMLTVWSNMKKITIPIRIFFVICVEGIQISNNTIETC